MRDRVRKKYARKPYRLWPRSRRCVLTDRLPAAQSHKWRRARALRTRASLAGKPGQTPQPRLLRRTSPKPSTYAQVGQDRTLAC